MKTAVIAIAALAALSGCTTIGPVAGLESGSLARYDCEGQGFSARIAEDFTSVRLRTHEGSVNLNRGEDDAFAGDGWKLTTRGGMELAHKDKIVAKNCKKQS